MHSKRPEYGQRQTHGDRDRRWRDEYDKRQEERYEYHRNGQWDSYHHHGRSGSGRTERSSISTDYSDSPQKRYSKDSLVRDRDADRRSPVRGRLSSPDRRIAEKKRRRFTDDSRDAYSYGFEPDGKKYRQSPDHFPRDYKHPLPQEVRRSMQDSRIHHRHEEFTSRYHQPYDSSQRQLSTHNKAREDQGRNHSCSPERNLPQDDSKKRDVKSRERKNSSPAYGTDRARNYLDASKRQSLEDVTKPSHDIPEKKFSNGFQRFLDVLNKGVDVEVLNQIVIQTPGKDCGHPPSAASSHNAADHPCVPGEQVGQQNVSKWNEENFGDECHRQPFPQSFSPKRSSPYDDRSVQRSDVGQGCTRSKLPPVAEKKRLTPDDEHKHQQIQEVLQAIGVDLGSEELGQMSHRIKERLYGKKESHWSYQSVGSRERVTRSVCSPRRRSRSRSSSSSASSSSRSKHSYSDYSVHRDSYNAQSNFKEDQAWVPSATSNSRASLDHQKCEIQATVSPNATCTTLRPTMLTTPAYGPVNTSPMVYPPLFPNISNVGPRLLYPPLQSLPPHTPLLPFPCRPPFMTYSCPSPLNVLPSVLAQTRHLLPPPMSNIQPSFLNLPNAPVALPKIDTPTKSKMLPRPRCLLVIDTKQPS
ncbi:uncharacterized protein LOC109521761 isoform X1 [Hippocampus comes]|uniref:uncharacterized protein LOC109521761 isoform X1 n=1 Tax=Hippocampus comes TaxID=109280 RepID=UPI00094E8E19|nr:PREDICTED: uncharacterized protein LOC109521761 isoform X1 [Hippocampus comes]